MRPDTRASQGGLFTLGSMGDYLAVLTSKSHFIVYTQVT